MSVKNSEVEARAPTLACHNNCLYKCSNLINAEGRQILCRDFWELSNIQRQRDYIVARVNAHASVRTRVEQSRRKFSHEYFFIYLSRKYRVCKKFFLSTLNISEKMMRTALTKANRSIANVPSPDCRGKHPPGIKLPQNVITLTEKHIDSFPTVPAHWCRKDSNKVYLESILNKESMFSFYLEFCKDRGIKPVSKTLYREILIQKNIGFYHPRKDQCWCYGFEENNVENRPNKQNEYELHKKRKDAANSAKKEDGDRARHDDTFVAVNFEEAVLYCPLLLAKPIFYKRKLAVYNFTIYEVAKQKGHCFLWDETTGKRGANEIATCLSIFIENLPPKVKHLTLYSDNCPGQNRNSIVASMLFYCLNKSALESIEIKFLEAGHTHMECDSIHATIETASKNAKIFVPSDWYNVINLAKKRGEPYKIHELEYTDFKNFKRYKDTTMPNCHIDKDKNNLNWKHVRCIKFLKDTPNIRYYKNEYWDATYKELDMQYRSGKGRPRQPTIMTEVPRLYDQRLKVDAKKYKDLMDLCENEVIPPLYHDYYRNLGSQNNQEAEQDSSEDEIDLQTMRQRFKKR